MKDKVVSVLTQTPLQVTILLIIIRARGAPPKQREELFDRYMDIIYQREQKKGPELLRTEQDLIYGLHNYLAYILHKRAEQDKTAALMDVSEFEEKVKEYLKHGNQLLTKEELQEKVNQIITEASQRLVLIESPQEKKVGFGLTTTREFFAAAHLVDAKDTKERDLRFKAIAKSPYWRNVALFFAGRVGRTRPGEAPSMIDVCREIDIEKVDKFLKRGAELVMEMADDRVLRVVHNEIGAIQYGLTLIDRGFIREPKEFIEKLKSFPDHYKDRVIRPFLEERLKTVLPENLGLYTDIYQALFGINETLLSALKKESESDSPEIRLLALSKAIENRVVELWVIKLLEELIDIIPKEKIIQSLSSNWINFRFYLDFSLSSKARTVIAHALLEGIPRNLFRFDSSNTNIRDELSMIKIEGKFIENSLLLWAVCQLSILAYLSIEEEARTKIKDGSVMVGFPRLANPKVHEILKENEISIRKFCKTFSNEKEPFVILLVAVFEFLLEPQNYMKYNQVLKLFRENEEFKRPISMVSLILEIPNEIEELFSYHKNIYTIHNYYQSEEQYRRDIEELNEIVNKQSDNIRNHPEKLLTWIYYNYDPKIEGLLDPEIINELKIWLQYRGCSEKVLSIRNWNVVFLKDLESSIFILDIVENQLKNKAKHLEPWVRLLMADYKWQMPLTKDELIIKNRIKHIFEDVLKNYDSLIDPEHKFLGYVYWSALNAKVVTEKHIAELYKIVNNETNFPPRSWIVRGGENVRTSLIELMQIKTFEITCLTAESLSELLYFQFIFERKIIEESWIGDKFWELAKNKEHIWHLKYIRGMAFCRLNWEKNREEWLKAIKAADTEKLQKTWCKVIENAGYNEREDRDAFFNILLNILESGTNFAEPIRIAAFHRLYGMVSEIEPVGFDEEKLNLPLSRR